MLSFVLFILSFVLNVILTPIGICYTLVKAVVFWDFKPAKTYFFNLAVSLDQFGGVSMSGLFNMILISSNSKHLFGNPDETISSVIGKNKLEKTLLPLGKCLDLILNRLDDNHSINSIE